MAYTWTVLTGLKTVNGSIANLVNRSDLPTENILIKAQALIYDKLRVREMMSMDDLALASGEYKGDLPDGFLDPVKLTPFGWGEQLDYQSEDRFVSARDIDGNRITEACPGSWTIIGGEFVFDIELTESFGGELVFYQQPDNLSGSDETNFLTTRYPVILEHMALSFAYEHMKDAERSLEYRQKAEAEILQANANNELFRRGQR